MIEFTPEKKETVTPEGSEMKKEKQMFPFVDFEPADEYHARSKSGEFLSSHMLGDFRQKGALYYHKKIKGEIPDRDSSAYLVGRAAHCLILEGQEAFDKEFFVTDGPINEKSNKPYGKDTKAYKEWLKEQDPTKQFITTTDLALIETMKESVDNHPATGEMLAAGEAEGVIRAEVDGHPCQIRMDFLSTSHGLVDLKTCADLNWFEYDAKKFGYYHQLAFYQRVIQVVTDRLPPVWIIAVEKQEPFRTGVWKLDEACLQIATNDNANAIIRLKECFETDVWPTGFEDVRTLKTKYLN